MSAHDPPPPPPPPHGQNPRPPGAMPDGNYDIFIIPPHSAGSGFLYLPSLGTQRNSFLAGVACTLLAVGVYTLVMPVLREWMNTVFASGGVGVLLLVVGVGVAGWAWGKTQEEWNRRDGGAGAGSASAGAGPQHHSHAPPPQPETPPPPPQHESAPPPKPEPRAPPPKPSAASGWEKAREETRKREEARKREEELKKIREEMQRKREEAAAAAKAKTEAAEKEAKAKAEKEKWEQVRAREKERREREARERIQREREAKQNAEKNKSGSAPAASVRPSPTKPYAKPTAKSYAGTEESYSYRPYDTAKTHTHKSSASSVSGLSESSYAPSATTARTTPPPSQRGPYTTKDPDKIMIKAVYLFSDSFPTKPISSLISNQGAVTDGLVLRIQTAGIFIDDDVRGVPQREWDVKAWTLKLVEDGVARGVGAGGAGLHVLRATTRDAENKRYTFVLDETEAWKVAVGLARLRKGSQPKVLGMGSGGMKEAEVKGLLSNLGWI